MRVKFILLFIVGLLFFSGSLQAQDQVSIASAKITFHFISKDVKGSLSGFESSSKIYPDRITESSFKGAVQVETIKTGNFLRDWSLKSGKYFDADTYPTITFESTQITKTSNGFTVTGTLTLKGTAKTISFNFTEQASKLVGTTTLFSSDFGIDIKKERQDNKVNVSLTLDLGN
ncbi:YceI family protein [Zobellia sp. B3R18]|uniref:YceI family protein n=1 Tax=Zobellia sp. B3R18 TaxID=2841568 RepID=UPI001C06836E|nr:YceI family protein [Zobellia sp. B3R18]MBU2973151.1 YceI family protein [Zobellia sp. B3R18]